MANYLIIGAGIGLGAYYLYDKANISNLAHVVHNIKNKYTYIKNIISDEHIELKNKYYINTIHTAKNKCLYSYKDYVKSINNILYKDNTIYYFNDIDNNVIDNKISKNTLTKEDFPLLITYTVDSNIYHVRICDSDKNWIFPFYSYNEIKTTCSLEWDNLTDELKKFAGPKGNFHTDLFINTPKSLNNLESLNLLSIFAEEISFDQNEIITFK